VKTSKLIYAAINFQFFCEFDYFHGRCAAATGRAQGSAADLAFQAQQTIPQIIIAESKPLRQDSDCPFDSKKSEKAKVS
jgi:hypothetical protein